MVGDDDLRARVLAQAAAAPSRTRTEARKIATALVAGSVAIAVTIFELIGGIDHSNSRPRWITYALAGGWGLASAALSVFVVGRSRSSMARRPILLLIAALVTPLLVFGWMHLFYSLYPDPPFRIGYRCLGYSLLFSALPLASFLALRRAIEPRHPSMLGAAAGAACAAWAGALIDLWCPLTNPLHVLVGHVLPIVIAMIVGAIAGRFMLGIRRNQPRSST